MQSIGLPIPTERNRFTNIFCLPGPPIRIFKIRNIRDFGHFSVSNYTPCFHRMKNQDISYTNRFRSFGKANNSTCKFRINDGIGVGSDRLYKKARPIFWGCSNFLIPNVSQFKSRLHCLWVILLVFFGFFLKNVYLIERQFVCSSLLKNTHHLLLQKCIIRKNAIFMILLHAVICKITRCNHHSCRCFILITKIHFSVQVLIDFYSTVNTFLCTKRQVTVQQQNFICRICVFFHCGIENHFF